MLTVFSLSLLPPPRTPSLAPLDRRGVTSPPHCLSLQDQVQFGSMASVVTRAAPCPLLRARLFSPPQPPATHNHFSLRPCCSHRPERLFLRPPLSPAPYPIKGHLSEALPDYLSRKPLIDREARSPDLTTRSSETLTFTADDQSGCTRLPCCMPLILTAALGVGHCGCCVATLGWKPRPCRWRLWGPAALNQILRSLV